MERAHQTSTNANPNSVTGGFKDKISGMISSRMDTRRGVKHIAPDGAPTNRVPKETEGRPIQLRTQVWHKCALQVYARFDFIFGAEKSKCLGIDAMIRTNTVLEFKFINRCDQFSPVKHLSECLYI
jgi:hypothetical protein